MAWGGAFEWAACDAIMLAGGGRAATDAHLVRRAPCYACLPMYVSPCDASGRMCLHSFVDGKVDASNESVKVKVSDLVTDETMYDPLAASYQTRA